MAGFGALLLLGASLVIYSTDWLLHDLKVFRLHGVARDIREGKSVAETELANVLSEALVLDRAQELRSSDLDDAALVASLFADHNARNPVQAPALFATAERLLRARLALAPADGNSWLRLAFVHTARFGLDTQARQALRMSWLVTPREFSVMWPGLRFRMDHWQELTVEEQFAAADLITGLWHKPPERDTLRHYLAGIPADRRKVLLTRIVDPTAANALSAPGEPLHVRD